jgi:hypothetical protein
VPCCMPGIPPIPGVGCVPCVGWLGCIMAMLLQHGQPLDDCACCPGCPGIAWAVVGRAHIPPVCMFDCVVLPVVAAVCCIIGQANAGVAVDMISVASVTASFFMGASREVNGEEGNHSSPKWVQVSALL